MEQRTWAERLHRKGIRVERLISLRDWSESRVLCVEGTRQGEPVVCYLKWARRGMETESAVYRFAARHPSFPAPRSEAVVVDGEEWLLLDRVDGALLADVAKKGSDGSYVTAARGMARFHTQGAISGWPTQLPSLGTRGQRMERLPSRVLESLRRKMVAGEYSGVKASLLSSVASALERSWFGYLSEFRSYPNSLIHGDCHFGNIFLTPKGGISLIDWASASIAPGMMDLAALVDVTQRMGEPMDPEPAVLAGYLHELAPSSKDAYGTPERAWTICLAVRALMELEWFATTGEDYGERAQRELFRLDALLRP